MVFNPKSPKSLAGFEAAAIKCKWIDVKDPEHSVTNSFNKIYNISFKSLHCTIT